MNTPSPQPLARPSPWSSLRVQARLVRKSLRQHALSTAITAASIAMASALLFSVWIVKDQSVAAFTGMTGGFDGVLGARGSKLQLVLNALFHVEESPGNLPWNDFLDIQKNPNVDLAVPVAVGDNYRGFRLVGTTLDLFHKAELRPGQHLRVRPGGRLFDPTLREAVVGSHAAARLQLSPGTKFQPYHGLIFDERNQHTETYVVVGILEPSNTPADRVIWIPLEGLQRMSGHDPKAAADISAVLVKLKSGNAGFLMDLFYNKQGNRLTFAWPVGRVMAQLFDKIGWFDRVLALVAQLTALVATASILASLHNSMSERRREIAILRALGARRTTVFSALVLEAATIAALGVTLGFLLTIAMLGAVAALLRNQIGVVLNPLALHPILLWGPLAMVSLGALAGLLPAWTAYRTDVANNLTPHS